MLRGYLFWQSLDEVIAIVQRGSLALGGAAAVVVAVVAAYRHLRKRTSRGRSVTTVEST